MENKYQQAMLNPTSVYDHPRDVLKDASLEPRQKLAVLTNWEAEATHLQESTAEGFSGGEDSLLAEIKAAARQAARAVDA